MRGTDVFGGYCRFRVNKCHIINVNYRYQADEVAEWLRRWTANPMCSARVGSNPILVDIFAHTWVREAKKIYQQPSKGESGKCHVQNTKKGFPTPGIEPGPPG